MNDQDQKFMIKQYVNSDFAVVLDKLKEAKKRVLVMSTRGHVAKELLERAKFIDLRKIKKEISQ